jgi:hypothetical protein
MRKQEVRVSQFSLKTGGYGLVIWASKSARWFLGLGIKTKGDGFLVCTSKLSERRFVGLRLKNDEWMKMV